LSIIKNYEDSTKEKKDKNKNKLVDDKLKENQIETYLKNLETEMKDIEVN
jgi:hypothetical protein